MMERLRRPEEVHLEQAELLDRSVQLVLGDDLGVITLALDRDELGERDRGDHHRGGVDRVLTAQPLEARGRCRSPDGLGIGGVRLAEPGARWSTSPSPRVGVDRGRLVEALPERRLLAEDGRRHQLGQPVADEYG